MLSSRHRHSAAVKIIEAGIMLSDLNQFLMGTLLYNAALIHDHYSLSHAHRGEPMGNQNGGAAFREVNLRGGPWLEQVIVLQLTPRPRTIVQNNLFSVSSCHLKSLSTASHHSLNEATSIPPGWTYFGLSASRKA